MATVAVGISGGVDSAVSALLLKQQGHRVLGLFMKNWDEKDENGVCRAAEDHKAAEAVCRKLDIPLYAVEFVDEYRDRVFKRFLEEYRAGETPNPDILCNREIKFKAFFEHAMNLGADYLATGHYCRVGPNRTLLKGRDPGKDQSYFVYTISKELLNRVLFPIGDLLKSEVRALAEEAELPNFDRKDSTGICFIGERNFRNFLQTYIKSEPGEFRQLGGAIVGEHQGHMFYTLGQRRGLGLGGEGDRWFVVGKDVEKNLVYVERGDHPALYTDMLEASELSWVLGDMPFSEFECRAKVRYRQKDQSCLVQIDGDRAIVRFREPQRAVATKQSIVFYDGDTCLGGGVIERAWLKENSTTRTQLRQGSTVSID